MNQRIKELALKSNLRSALLLHYWGNIDALTDSEQEELEHLEKFTQLIVRECAKIADIADENKCEWIGGNILTHFGVEE